MYENTHTRDQQWLQKATDVARQAVAASSDLAAALVALGSALAAGGQSREAAEQFERARDLNPNSGPSHLGLAKLRSGPEAEQLY
jgi:Flp pilus assembly protein TadD